MPLDNSRYTLLLIRSLMRGPEKIAGILENAGFQVRMSDEPESPGTWPAEGGPDLILVDMEQADKQEIPVLRELRKRKTACPVPVLLITSGGSGQEWPDCLLYDHVDFIIRPFRPRELITRLQRQLLLLQAERTIRRQNEKLKKTLEARDKLYSVIAHDLRAPIGTIKMINASVERLKGRIGDPEVVRFFEMINETTEEAFNLLENLLRWSRTQNGRTRVYAGVFNLQVVIRQVLSLFATIARAKDITLENKAAPGVTVYADEDMIKTVLRNLISNAVKFTYPGGLVEVEAAAEGEVVRVTVRDNGKGISKEIRQRLLKPNEYITTYGTHNEKGSGIGLALCRDFVRLNKGEFGFRSQEGVGTEFYFTLPRRAPRT